MGDDMSVLQHGGSDLSSICFCLHVKDWLCTQHRLQKHLLLCKMSVTQLKIWVNPSIGFSKEGRGWELLSRVVLRGVNSRDMETELSSGDFGACPELGIECRSFD